MAAEKNKDSKKEESGNMIKMVLLYVGAMAVMTAIAIVLVVMVIGPKMSPAPMLPIQQTQAQTQSQASTGEPNGLASHVVDVGDEFIVNPSGSNGLRYLSVKMSAAVSSADTEALLNNHQAQLSHIVVSVISARTIAELEEPGWMEKLGEDLKNALNEVFGEGQIQRIFFRRFIIQ